MKLIIHPAVEPERLQRILQAAGDMQIVNAEEETEALSEISSADAFFGKMTPALLETAQELRWVQSPTASLEHYLFPELIDHPCQLTNMRGLYNDCLADHVFAFLLCFARHIPHYVRNQMQAHWEAVGGESSRPDFLQGPSQSTAIIRNHQTLSGQTLGVVGLGHAGMEIARRGVAFRMRVLGIDPLVSEVPDGVEWLGKPDRLPALLAESDFVVIAAPHTPETERMFARPQFRLMKDSAYLINIGRGVIVDLTDLTAALQAQEIAGAGLDVFEVEPLPAEHPLWRMENVLLTPHVAGYFPDLPNRHLAVLLDNIHRFRHDEPLRNVVDKRRWF